MDSTKKGVYRFFRSLRFRILVFLVLLGIVPSFFVSKMVISAYEDRAVSLRISNVKNHCDILCNKIVTDNYLIKPDSVDISSKLELLSNVYSGRILLIDRDFRIVKDTYNLDEGKTVLSEDAIKCFRGESISQYNKENHYLEMAIPIQNLESKKMLGVMLISISTNEIVASMQVLEQKSILILGILIALVLVLAYFLSGVLVKPLARVTKAIEDLTDGYQKDTISVPDYTETELITDAFNKMLSRMKVLDESRQEFVSNVSHELKTPLTSMKVLADSLVGQENVPVELYQEFMQDITEEIDRENKIISDLLSLVKMDKKAADLNIQQININKLLESILKRLRPIADRRNIDLILDSFRPVEADVDEVKFTLAISNLVENGIKYNVDDGWVRVSLDADHKYFYVTVADSGMGIPEESIERIFERFYRVDKSHSREIGGTGLGLAITRSAIAMHHGAIKVYSKEDEGTTFSVRIPLSYIP
ncbi:MAG: sensor histidine kinase [Blautia sp.]|jgi:signal transduction histidine kinase